MRNIDHHTADGFDRIWSLYGDPGPPDRTDEELFRAYFSIFPFERLSEAEGFDLGCGNGRMARCVASRVGLLHCIDPSGSGLEAARAATAHLHNLDFHQASVGSMLLPDESQDFGYSIGVLHHIPDPAAGLRSCVAKLKPGAPFLLYLYYRFDNRPMWFRGLWRLSDVARRGISSLPFRLRAAASTFIAATAYWPLSRAARLLRRLGAKSDHFPLSYYADHDWATLRADSLDRFGTRIEHRFTKREMQAMMEEAGLHDVHFADGPPYWIALGHKR